MIGLLSEKTITIVERKRMWYGLEPRGIRIGRKIVTVRNDKSEILIIGQSASVYCRETTPDQYLFDLREVLVKALGDYVAVNMDEPEVVAAELARIHAIPELSFLFRSGTWCQEFKTWVEELLWGDQVDSIAPHD